jgi:hypothetical protein
LDKLASQLGEADASTLIMALDVSIRAGQPERIPRVIDELGARKSGRLHVRNLRRIKPLCKRSEDGMNRVAFAGIVCILTAAPLEAGDPREAAVAGGSILASEFPKTASRAMFFEDRINSRDSSVRARVLTEVGYFYSLPENDYVSFLKRMYQDPNQLVRGRAIKKLYDMWVPQDPESLPLVFTGYHNTQVVVGESDTTAGELIEQCSAGGTTAGYAAYVLGLLRAEEAIPALRKLRADGNIFVRYTAARALLDCGDRSSAIAIFDEMSSKQLAIYESGSTTEDAGKLGRRSKFPWYAACACRGLIEVGGKEERKGLKRLIELMGFLERSKDVNDQSKIHWVRGMLAATSGEYFTSSEEASEWMTQDQ